MKKTMALALMCSALPIHAFSKLACTNLIVTVKNNTGAACQLIDRSLKNGRSVGPETYFKIPDGERKTVKLAEVESTQSIEFLLSYDCGAGGLITFNTEKYGCLFGGGKILGSITSITGMYAKYESTVGVKWPSTPGRIVWDLNASQQ
ncbi:MAG: hypothetical protein NXI01_00090 [Gammaproteobacteria bacterium]|nr:hypothetical protein [Gammaproteobacteria bacterium]